MTSEIFLHKREGHHAAFGTHEPEFEHTGANARSSGNTMISTFPNDTDVRLILDFGGTC